MARSNCITSANLNNSSTVIGTTLRIGNSYPPGLFRTFNSDTDAATANKQNKPGVKVTINS